MKKKKQYYLPKAKYIQLLHIAKSKLELTDDEYIAVLEGATGKTSSKDMSLAELDDCWKRFKELGFELEKQKNPKGFIKGLSSQGRMIMALWNEIKDHKNFRNKSAEVIEFLKSQNITKADNIKTLKPYEANKAIELLKKYKTRLEV